jgi:hypothetical protein
MEDLIKALQILVKYGNPHTPTHCEHDVLTICYINPDDVTPEDKESLDSLGFHVSEGDDGPCFISYRFGSA